MVGATVGNGDGWDVGYEVVGFDDGFGVGRAVGAADGCRAEMVLGDTLHILA